MGRIVPLRARTVGNEAGAGRCRGGVLPTPAAALGHTGALMAVPCSAAIEAEAFEYLGAIIAIERAPAIRRASLFDDAALPLLTEEEM